MTIYVSNFNFRLQETDLNRMFAVHGRVEWANVIRDRATRRSKGFGFVKMPDDAAAGRAIAALHGTLLGGRTITVGVANTKETGLASSIIKE